MADVEEQLVARLTAIDGRDIALTTNGALLPQKARALADAGLKRVTVSLDSLDDAAFRAMNDVDFPVQRVLEGIDAAAAAGLPVKVNAVVKRGANDGDLLALAEHFRGSGPVLRFIEYMDVGGATQWSPEKVVSRAEMLEEWTAVRRGRRVFDLSIDDLAGAPSDVERALIAAMPASTSK